VTEEQDVNETERAAGETFDPDESPFTLHPIAGIPFGKRSEEARAIERVIAEADRERASSDP
jgi:hypothetical protein